MTHKANLEWINTRSFGINAIWRRCRSSGRLTGSSCHPSIEGHYATVAWKLWAGWNSNWGPSPRSALFAALDRPGREHVAYVENWRGDKDLQVGEVSLQVSELISFQIEAVKQQLMMEIKKRTCRTLAGNEITCRGSRTPQDSLLKSHQPAEQDALNPSQNYIEFHNQRTAALSALLCVTGWCLCGAKVQPAWFFWFSQKSSLVKILLSSSHYTLLGSHSSLSIITIRSLHVLSPRPLWTTY